MAVHNHQITAAAREYLERWPTEEHRLSMLLEALQKNLPLYGREQFAAGGHVTCGAAVLNEVGELLFILNRRLGRWLLPGGHLDAIDSALQAVALRELAEETGITESSIVASLNQSRPIDIGIYMVPANTQRKEPAHWHADFCFAFMVRNPEFHLQSTEIGGYKWLRSYEHLIPDLCSKIQAITQEVKLLRKRMLCSQCARIMASRKLPWYDLFASEVSGMKSRTFQWGMPIHRYSTCLLG